MNIDTARVVVGGLREVQHLNHLRSISIPLTIGYEYEFGKMSFAVNGGIAVSIASGYEGKIVDPTNIPIDISSQNGAGSQIYKQSLGLSLQGSLGIHYRLNERISLLAEPSFRYYLKPINLTSNPITHRYSTIGILTGIRYKF